MAENQYDFPTEVLDLPSKGLLYPKENPLSSGRIDKIYDCQGRGYTHFNKFVRKRTCNR